MTSDRGVTSATRQALVLSTRRLHEALHRDPILDRLTASDVTLVEYQKALTVFFEFFGSVEKARQRKGCWPDFSLQSECTALSVDLETPPIKTVELDFASDTEMLGGLYVAHGAMFGRAVFRRNIKTALPHAPDRFLRLQTALSVWKALGSALEEAGCCELKRMELTAGARAGFEAVARLLQQVRKSV